MLAIVNEKDVTTGYDPRNDEEDKENGFVSVRVEGHEDVEKFFESLERLSGDTAGEIEAVLQTFYDLGIEQGKKLEHAKHQSAPTNQPSLSMRR